jgi:hypothetical protein
MPLFERGYTTYHDFRSFRAAIWTKISTDTPIESGYINSLRVRLENSLRGEVNFTVSQFNRVIRESLTDVSRT